MNYRDWDLAEYDDSRPPDPKEVQAREELRAIFEKERTSVFFGRQLEVRLEKKYFHWLTGRALRKLEAEGEVISEFKKLGFGGRVKLYWHKRNRYVKRGAARIVELVEQYSAPGVSGALGHHGELLIVEAFARNEYLVKGRETNEYRGIKWGETEHNLDLVVEKDGIGYGIEVKNTLPYMEEDEFKTKKRLSEAIGLKPVFAVRMIPVTWAEELISEGGYAMILGWQLYPRAQADLAKRVRTELGLPVDSPKALYQGTMDKFNKWHQRNM
jgi:hypothetical protein